MKFKERVFSKNKPSEKQILEIKNSFDDGYSEAMRHANQLLGYNETEEGNLEDMK